MNRRTQSPTRRYTKNEITRCEGCGSFPNEGHSSNCTSVDSRHCGIQDSFPTGYRVWHPKGHRVTVRIPE